MSSRVAVIAVPAEGLPDGAQPLLDEARTVVATRVLLTRVRGLVPPHATVDVLGDTAYDDLGGHRWDLPDDAVAVLVPPDRVRGVAQALADVVGDRLVAIPADLGVGDVVALDVPDLTVVGVDLVDPLPPAARAAVRNAQLVAGGRWHLDALGDLLHDDARRLELSGDLDAVLDQVVAYRGPAVVLASGDPGFFGILRLLGGRVSGRLRVLPAVSSVARVCAAAGVSWDDALVASAHGRDPRPAVNACRRHPKVVVLTAPGFGPAELAAELPNRDLVVAERLGLPDAEVTRVDRDAAQRPWRDPNVVLVLDPDAAPTGKGRLWPSRRTPAAWALPEDRFDHRDGMITKAEVRALVLAWLGPGVGDLVWDIGAGSGAVAIECSRLGAAAIAVERDAEQCDRVRRNAAHHAAPVEVVQGDAPAALGDLPDPDAVFVGGGGAQLAAILTAAAARRPRVVVAALATLERVDAARRALADAGCAVDGVLLQASRLAPLADGHRLAATNPVLLLRGAP